MSGLHTTPERLFIWNHYRPGFLKYTMYRYISLDITYALASLGIKNTQVRIMGTFCFLDALVGVVVVGFCDVGLEGRVDLDFCLSFTTSTQS